MAELADRERTLILMALWNYKLQAGQVNAPMGAAEEERVREQAPEGPLIRSTPSSPRWAGTPICRCSVSAAPSPDSEAGTTHASRLGVCNASLVHDCVQWRSRLDQLTN